MGWIFVIGFAILTFAGLYLSGRCTRVALEISGAILLVGVAGYAWQGSPEMAGNPVSQAAQR
jgi:cytochrome c-type biogenesis protein CcmH